MINIKADLHTHTINSGHAYSTIDELARTASKKGIEVLAITEHGPNMPDGPYKYYFNNISILPDEIYGVRILKGVEANILDQGNLDLSDEILSGLDFVAAGIHYNTGHSFENKNDYTKAMIKAIQNPYVCMITHPVNSYYPVDLVPVVKAAKRNNVILELNASSYNSRKSTSRGDREKTLKLCHLAKKLDVYLSCNSDAHFHQQVGDISNLEDIIKEAELDHTHIINSSKNQVLNQLIDTKYMKKNII